MSHEIKVLLAPRDVAFALAARMYDPHVVELPQGFSLIPLCYELDLNDEKLAPETVESIKKNRDRRFELVAREVSSSGPIVLITTSYFGGIGSQSATVFLDRSEVASYYEHSKVRSLRSCSCCPQGAINTALRWIGVIRDAGKDEFDTMCLGWYRDTDDWLKEKSLLDG